MTAPTAPTVPITLTPDADLINGRRRVDFSRNPVAVLLGALWIVLVPFQDTALQQTPLGFLGASPSFLPAAALAALLFWQWALNGAAIGRVGFGIAFYVVAVNVIYLCVFGSQSHGRDTSVKAINLLVLATLTVVPAVYIDFGARPIRLAVVAAFGIAVAGVVAGDVLEIGLFRDAGPFHFMRALNGRPRGLSSESSWAASCLSCLGLLTVYVTRQKWARVAILVVLSAALVFAASKGAMITLPLSFVLAGLLFSLKRKSIAMSIGLFLLAVLAAGFGIFILATLRDSFERDLGQYTSTASRVSLILFVPATIARHPFGVGFTGFLPAINRYLPEAMGWAGHLLDTSRGLREVSSYVGGDNDQYVAVKSTFFQYTAYFGIPFAAAFTWFHYRLIRRLVAPRYLFLLCALLVSLVALVSYMDGVGVYHFSVVYGMCLWEARRSQVGAAADEAAAAEPAAAPPVRRWSAAGRRMRLADRGPEIEAAPPPRSGWRAPRAAPPATAAGRTAAAKGGWNGR